MGPLFFILFIKDLPLHVSSQIDLYADDTTITTSSDFRNISHLELSLNTSVSEIRLWANANKLPLNEEKTTVLVITGKSLQPAECYNRWSKNPQNCKQCYPLGFRNIIDNMLSFNLHVEMIGKRLSSRIAVLRKIRAFLPLSQRLLYYNAIICPVLSYVSVIWSSCNKELLYRVLKLQKRAAREILYVDPQASSVALFNKLHWIPFYEQCNLDKCSILYKRIHGSLPSYLDDHLVINYKRHSRNTRYANFNAICPKYKRETEGGRTFAVSASRLCTLIC